MLYLKIPPNNISIAILLGCATISYFLFNIGYTGGIAPATPHPWFTLVLSFIALYTESRIICFAADGITIKYLFGIKRRIPADRIRGIQFVYREQATYLFVALDDCQSFANSEKSIRHYIFLHPIKLIATQISTKKRIAYYNIISKMYSNVTCLGWEPGQGDDLREP